MALARCPEPECQCVLDVPEIQASWRCPDGRCAACNNLSAEDLKAMKLPEEVIKAHAPAVAKLLYKSSEQAAQEPKNKRAYVVRGEVSDNLETGMPVPALDGMPVIDTGIPIPDKKPKVAKKPPRYPFAKMRAPRSPNDMDSFFVKLASDTPVERSKLAGAISSAAYAYRKTHGLNIKFTVRCVDGGVRCWRTA